MPCGKSIDPAGKLPLPNVVPVPHRALVAESLAASLHPPQVNAPVAGSRLYQVSASTSATA